MTDVYKVIVVLASYLIDIYSTCIASVINPLKEFQSVPVGMRTQNLQHCV